MPNANVADKISRSRLSPLASDDEIAPPAPAIAADEPLVPLRDGHLGSIPLGHLGGVGFELVPAIETPHDQPHPRRRGVAQRHRPAVKLHGRSVRQNENKTIIVDRHRSEFRKETLTEEWGTGDRTDSRGNICCRMIANLHLVDNHTLLDCLRAIGHKVRSLTYEISLR
jgi:hypothetical protein